ncbi:exosome subunit Rrp40 [Schizosaccharomyces cryophilus OY26]|uniref:Ribosomal RNA-processing protein 40 n=1 Tax=Schizosaccharomyces cryophilus (strain OY26 / ATCC MYA-4695 / CBS 11777 / NBRC 106824 / NRRL Y48691) TaxID=653667 RepID=S9XAU0_SCHCR|nr:exosome subunit Rrp40 [Schizosaccharomyces cryophilus OY26]EPY50846.1 exosome subunit Rrp40 [Schizosaccharomyces cryophilus OY26]
MSEVEESGPVYYFPGDNVKLSTVAEQGTVRLGPGLVHQKHDQEDEIKVSRAGFLHQGAKNTVLVDTRMKRYVPAMNDQVIGQVTSRFAEGYRVDIGSAHSAQLNALAFENVTRKSKPNLAVGSLVYARVSLADRDMEPELECVDATTGKAGGFGELKDGYMITGLSLSHCRNLLTPKNALLQTLGTYVPFEIAVGMNGRVWVHSETIPTTILITNCIKKSEFLDDDERVQLVKSMVKNL